MAFPEAQSGDWPEYQRFAARIVTKDGARWPGYKVMIGELSQATPEKIRELLFSLTWLQAEETPSDWRFEREEALQLFLSAAGMNTLFCEGSIDLMIGVLREPLNKTSELHKAAALGSFLKAAQASGTCLSDRQRNVVATFAQFLEKSFHNPVDKERQKSARKYFKSLRAFIGTDHIDSLWFETRIAPPPQKNHFPIEPEVAEFWRAFVLKIATVVETFRGKLKENKGSTWVTESARFAQSYPLTAHLPIAEEKWRSLALDAHARMWEQQLGYNDMAPELGLGAFNTATTPDFNRQYQSLSRIADHQWNKVWVPASNLLLMDGDQADLSFLHALLTAPDGPKTPPKWTKKAQVALQQIGQKAAYKRIASWLDVFNTPGVSPKTRAQTFELFHYTTNLATFQKHFPHWRDLNDTELTAIATWIALICMSNSSQSEPSLVKFWCWQKSVTGEPDFLPPRKSLGDRVFLSYHIMPSIENETVLKAALWMLRIIGGSDCVKLIETTAYKCTAIKISNNFRSLSTTNAAIATLGEIGTQEALEALGRLRRAIKDKSVGNAVEKAMAALASKLGVQTADIAEQSVPDYGFS